MRRGNCCQVLRLFITEAAFISCGVCPEIGLIMKKLRTRLEEVRLMDLFMALLMNFLHDVHSKDRRCLWNSYLAEF